MVSFLSDRIVLSTLLYLIAIVIAFGPEIRHSVSRVRANDRPGNSDSGDSAAN
jgi:hypothetical protein